MEVTRVSPVSIIETIAKVIEYPHLKIAVAYIALFLSWVFKGDMQILYIVYSLILLDTITGVWAVKKTQGWSAITSRQFFRGPLKFVVYLLLMYVPRMVDRAFPVDFAAPIMDGFLVSTEAVSILENLAKLEYKTPVFLIEKIKSFYIKK